MLRRMAIFDHLIKFRGAKRVKMSGDSLPEGEGRGEGERDVRTTGTAAISICKGPE